MARGRSKPRHGIGLQLVEDVVYLADGGEGLAIVDVSSTTDPTLIGGVDTPGTAYGVTVHDVLAYVADGDSGLLSVDVGNPQAPELVSTFAELAGWSRDLVISDGVACVTNGLAVRIIDVTVPEALSLLATLEEPIGPWQIALSGTQAIITGGTSNTAGVWILDVTSPTTPIVVGSATCPYDAQDIVVAGDAAYIREHLGGSLMNRVGVIEISDPTAPQ